MRDERARAEGCTGKQANDEALHASFSCNLRVHTGRLFGVLLTGIVAAQVEILKLGASMGRALEQTTTLTTQNEALRGNVAQLADDQRIVRLADNMGLVFPPPGDPTINKL